VNVTSSPITGRNGAVTGVVNLIRDVGREGELDRMKTELVKSVSHEFRTPLSAIVGLTEMLLQGDVEESKVGKYLGIIRNEGLRLTKMVTELLSILPDRKREGDLKIGRIVVEDLLKDVVGTFSCPGK
jgi:signal transduction histidine kinase